MMTIAFLLLAAASISFRFVLSFSASAFALFFVLHVVVGFSPLVYNFNKILLTNSGSGVGVGGDDKAAFGRTSCPSCPFLYLRFDWRMPNRYYYYNNSGCGSGSGSGSSSSGNNNCSNCLSALYLSILQLTLLALHTFRAL